jgi:hypothetical protein
MAIFEPRAVRECGIDRVDEPRPKRELENIIEQASRLREQTNDLALKLQDMRHRLLGESDPQAIKPGGTAMKESASELSNLKQVLTAAECDLTDIGRYIESLQRI